MKTLVAFHTDAEDAETTYPDAGVCVGEDGDLTVISLPSCDVAAQYEPGEWISVEVTA